MQQSPFFTQQTSVEKLNLEQEKTGLGASVLLARSEVPDSHRRHADAYMILKNHYGSPVVNQPLAQQPAPAPAQQPISPQVHLFGLFGIFI